MKFLLLALMLALPHAAAMEALGSGDGKPPGDGNWTRKKAPEKVDNPSDDEDDDEDELDLRFPNSLHSWLL